jgi:molybdopterin-guanine dinucleotide biosynthesis protein A
MTAFILAGGKSSRMGTDKGLTFFKGEPMIQSIINCLEKLNLPIVIVTQNQKYQQFGLPIISDLVKEKGPIGGIHTALTHTTTEKNIIVSCDTPNLDSSIFKELIDNANGTITIAKHKNRTHPLIGIYYKKDAIHFTNALNKNELKLGDLLNKLSAKSINFDKKPDKIFRNINTKLELDENQS